MVSPYGLFSSIEKYLYIFLLGIHTVGILEQKLTILKKASLEWNYHFFWYILRSQGEFRFNMGGTIPEHE